jgi:crotonobetainyl-CoA:carnitine CoA-transferase CaiB-like acyl-CoA transferase
MSAPDAQTGPGALANLTVIELANVVAGPSVGKHLADFGANVIKVEQPGAGDPARSMGETIGNRSGWWIVLGRNKRSITLNLKHPQGREAFLRLAQSADAVVESFRPGVLEGLDLSVETMQARNKRLVVVRISGFGQTGPYRFRPGFGTLAEAFSGLASISGYPDRPPLLAPTAIADEVAGLFGTWALLAALYHRDVAGGVGQVIDVSLYESLLDILGPLPTLYDKLGYQQMRNGSRLPFSSPRNVYRTMDGKYVVLSGTTPRTAERIVQVIGGSELLQDERFSTQESRSVHADDLDLLVERWIGERSAREVQEIFNSNDLSGMPILTMSDIFHDPHYAERQSLVAVQDEILGSVTMQAPVPRMSMTPGEIRWTGPSLGSDTDRILESIGFQPAQIERYRQEGAW